MKRRDLSEIHTQITDVFKNGLTSHRMLSAEDRSHFENHGYVGGFKLLSAGQVSALRSALDDVIATEGDDPRFYEFHMNESVDASKILVHALGAWRVSEIFHDLVFYRPIAAAAEDLLGGPVRFWHDQLFVKPPRDGGLVAWHQDYSYWTRTKPMAHLTCWIALDDSTIENGCVHYVPGSHNWGLLPRTDLSNDMESVIDHLNEEQRSRFEPVPIELRAGEASFHHAMLLHGSFENRSDRPRRGVVINMFRDGVCSDSNEPLLQGIPAIPKGKKIEGRYFPLISSTR
jgi:ectoine hydroxylase-related dioxygenase (phytanoyl-CoA dioxygenase family)